MAKDKASEFFTDDEQYKIVQTIRAWEKETTGEIKLHLENECKGDSLERAQKIFTELKLNETRKRNAVLIYLAVKSHKFAILGDTGIDNTVIKGFWDSIAWIIEDHFKQGLYLIGVLEAINLVGAKLGNFFPEEEGDADEVSNEISFA